MNLVSQRPALATYIEFQSPRCAGFFVFAVAAVEPARLRSAAKQLSNQNSRCVRQTASVGFTTAVQPNAASQARQLLQRVCCLFDVSRKARLIRSNLITQRELRNVIRP